MPSSNDVIGLLVHFVLDTGPNLGIHRPALVTSSNGGTTSYNMRVLVEPGDVPNGGLGMDGFLWRQGVFNDTTGTIAGSWHTPE